MKKGILLIVVSLLALAGFAQADEGELSGSLDVTYMTSNIWRGFDYYAGDHPALESGVTVDLYGTGFGVNVKWLTALSGEFVNAERISTSLFYSNSILTDEAAAINYTTGWVYYGFPDEPRSGSSDADAQAADMQEFFASFAWPNICPAGIVPSYTVLTMWPSEGNSAARKNSGWAHIIGLGYDLAVPGFLPDTPEQILHLSAAAVYNDGMAPGVVIGSASGTVEHDWSHAVFGVSTDFDIADNLVLTPAVYFQSSWEDTVNTEDETWATLNMKYVF